MGEKQRVESVHYFSFFSFLRDAIFACLQFSSFFLLFLVVPWRYFFFFCALGFFLQLQMGVVQLQLGAHFVTRDYGGGNDFLGGNWSF
jgi:hypothetical protein